MHLEHGFFVSHGPEADFNLKEVISLDFLLFCPGLPSVVSEFFHSLPVGSDNLQYA